jgi:hypothetical protein
MASIFKGIEAMPNENSPCPWKMYDFDKLSRVVVAVNDRDEGAVLYAVGGSVLMEMEEGGLRSIDDLGLYPPSAGIWVGEGKYTYYSGSYEYPNEVDSEASFAWRRPTTAEIESIAAGACPWNADDWLLSCVCMSDGAEGWRGYRKECAQHGVGGGSDA